MMLIGKTANWLLRHSVQRCVKSRRVVCAHERNQITRSVKVALKCLIAVVFVDVDLPYWTSKVEHLVRPRFPIRVQNFGDLATFYVDFCI